MSRPARQTPCGSSPEGWDILSSTSDGWNVLIVREHMDDVTADLGPRLVEVMFALAWSPRCR